MKLLPEKNQILLLSSTPLAQNKNSSSSAEENVFLQKLEEQFLVHVPVLIRGSLSGRM